jgi:hypothetical protein
MDLLEALYAERPHGFARTYRVDLLSEEAGLPDRALLEERLKVRCPQVVVAPAATGAADGGSLSLTLADTPDRLRPEWKITATAASHGRTPGSQTASPLETAVDQSWWWPEGARLLPRCTHSLVLRDNLTAALEPARRLELLQRILVAVLECQPCLVVHWLPSQQLIDPLELMNCFLDDDFTNPLPGAFNVRFYRIADESAPEHDSRFESDFLMDTVGLTALGSRDLQVHFRGLDPDEVGRTLYNLGLYLWQNASSGSGESKGAVIKDGDTVAGPRPNDVWKCQHEVSIATPERDLIDLDPGFPFTAGVNDDVPTIS